MGILFLRCTHRQRNRLLGGRIVRFTAIVIGLIAVLFGLPTLAATVQPVATVEPVAGKVSLNRGQGFKEVTGRAQANAGDQVMVNPGGRAKIVYFEGCMVDVRPGAVVGVAGSCKVAMAKPMTAGLEPVVAAPARISMGSGGSGNRTGCGCGLHRFLSEQRRQRPQRRQDQEARRGSTHARQCASAPCRCSVYVRRRCDVRDRLRELDSA